MWYISKGFESEIKQHDNHNTFLKYDITIKEGTFIYNLVNKRDSFPVSAVRMSHIKSNVPQNIFYWSIKSKFPRITCSTLCLKSFIPKAKELSEHIKQPDSKSGTMGTSLRKWY